MKKFNHIKSTFESFDSQLMTMWENYIDLVEGIDGIISEYGELPPRYWEEATAAELNRITDIVKDMTNLKEERHNIKRNLDALLVGITGWIAEKGPPTKYFKTGVIEKARVEASKTVL